jgi:hypothetical protein
MALWNSVQMCSCGCELLARRGGADKLAPLPAVAQQFPLLLLMPGAVSAYIATKLDRDLSRRQGALAHIAGMGVGEESLAAAISCRECWRQPSPPGT